MLTRLLRLLRPAKFEDELNRHIAQLEAILATNSDFSLKNIGYWEFVQRLEIYKEILQLYRETR